jgi:hypothetical protein
MDARKTPTQIFDGICSAKWWAKEH